MYQRLLMLKILMMTTLMRVIGECEGQWVNTLAASLLSSCLRHLPCSSKYIHDHPDQYFFDMQHFFRHFFSMFSLHFFLEHLCWHLFVDTFFNTFFERLFTLFWTLFCWRKQISKYIHINKNNMNKYPKRYLYWNIWIFSYSNIHHTLPECDFDTKE